MRTPLSPIAHLAARTGRRAAALLVALALFVSIVPAALAAGQPTGSGFTWLATPPSNIAVGKYEDDTTMFVFAERTNLALPSNVAVDFTASGTYDQPGDLPSPAPTIPAGTIVNSYYIHADQTDARNNVPFVAMITFPDPIIGVILTDDRLKASGNVDVLGVLGTTYPITGAHGYELTDACPPTSGQDCVTLSDDRRTLTLKTTIYNVTDDMRVLTKGDASPPAITPTVVGTLGNNGWYRSDVKVSWTVTDADSAVTSSSGCGSTTISTDTAETTLTCTATSAGGTNEKSVTIKRDATAPSLKPAVSPNPVLLNGSASASANATDNLSGIASEKCDAVDTSSVGSKTVGCTATDQAGNTAGADASYTVGYQVYALYDQDKAHKLGSTVPIKLQLRDASGANVSAASIVVSATGLTKQDNTPAAAEDSGSANSPDDNFRYDATLGGDGGYIYNLSTKDLSTGTWVLSFTVNGVDLGAYAVRFDVK